MNTLFRRLFNLYAGEERSAFLFASLGFIWALGVTAGQKIADVLFLLHVGAEALPGVYAMTACATIATAAFFLKAFHSCSIQRTFISVLAIGIAFYAFIYGCILTGFADDNIWIWYLLKIFATVFFTVTLTCFWTFTDQHFHLQDAKRIYSLVVAAEFLGIGATGGIMRLGEINFQHLPVLIILLIGATIYWIAHIQARIKPVYDNSALESSGDPEKGSFRKLIRSILSSRFTLLLMASSFLLYVLQTITEYTYMSAFEEFFDQGTAIVTGQEAQAPLMLFLGQCTVAVSALNLIFGLFIYSRCVRRYGVSSLFICTPLMLLIVFGGWSLFDTLTFPIMGFFVVEGLLYIIDDNNFALMLNAVPSKAKYKIRLIVESFFEPIGMLVSAFLLTLSPFSSKMLGLALAAVSILLALMMRHQYLKGIFQNLAENAVNFQRTARDWLSGLNSKEQKLSEKQLVTQLQSDQENAQLFAVETLIDRGDREGLQLILEHADKLSVEVKVAFLTMIANSSFSKESALLDRVHRWLRESPTPALKGAIHLYLARHKLLHPDNLIQDLYSTDLALRSASIMALRQSWAHLPPVTATYNRLVATRALQGLLDSAKEDHVCMAISILSIDGQAEEVDLLLPFIQSTSLKISRSAAVAVAKIADKHSIRYSPALLSQLESSSDSELRQSCLRALGKTGDIFLVKDIIVNSVHFRPNERRLTESIIAEMGSRTVPILLAITKDTTMHDRCRTLAGRIMGRLARPELRQHLYDIVSQEIDRSYFYFYHYHTIQADNPKMDLTLLRESLLNNFHSALDFIIQLLGMAGESEDCELLSQSLRSPNPKMRSHVIETLEKTCEPTLYRELYPLVADLPHAEKMYAYVKSGRPTLGLHELLDKLAQSPMRGDRLIAAAFTYWLDLPNWRESLRQQITTPTAVPHPFVYELLKT